MVAGSYIARIYDFPANAAQSAKAQFTTLRVKLPQSQGLFVCFKIDEMLHPSY